jgi:chemotaxis regulatin CheY-phosphate phosphatase CheZ
MGPVKQAAEMHNSKGSGSVTPAVDTENIIQSQDEVDDLLSSLGF